MFIASYNILTLISSCKRHFYLPFNQATLLLTLPFLVMSRMCFLRGEGGGGGGGGGLTLYSLSFHVTKESRRLCLTI